MIHATDAAITAAPARSSATDDFWKNYRAADDRTSLAESVRVIARPLARQGLDTPQIVAAVRWRWPGLNRNWVASIVDAMVRP